MENNSRIKRVERVGLVALLSLVAVVMLTFVFSANGNAATITVDDSGGEDYTTIQAAVNAANSGDTISIYPGTYDPVEIEDKTDLTLQRASGARPVIDAGGQSADGIYIHGSTSYITLNELEIKNAGSNSYSGIYIKSVTGDWCDNIKIEDCVIYDCHYGITLEGDGDDNIIGGNSISSGNTIHSNTYGVYVTNVDGANYALIQYNTIQYNTYGIYLAHSNYIDIVGNDLNADLNGPNTFGIYLDDADNAEIYENNVEDCTQEGITLHESDSCVISYNDIIDNGGYGVALIHTASAKYSTSNSIYYNMFKENRGSDTSWDSDHCQAYDQKGDDGGNYWWHVGSGEGNYWHDCPMDGNNLADYPIDHASGEDAVYDEYPLVDDDDAGTSAA